MANLTVKIIRKYIFINDILNEKAKTIDDFKFVIL